MCVSVYVCVSVCVRAHVLSLSLCVCVRASVCVSFEHFITNLKKSVFIFHQNAITFKMTFLFSTNPSNI